MDGGQVERPTQLLVLCTVGRGRVHHASAIVHAYVVGGQDTVMEGLTLMLSSVDEGRLVPEPLKLAALEGGL